MTAATTLPVSQLLQLKDDEFETTIKDMGQRNLMDTITGLQKEMAQEQENFNSTSEELKGFKDRNSRQYKQISKDLMASQTRLTTLMNKSMKCFAQQNLQQGIDGITLRRRNSAKGTNPNSPTKIVQRSKSMYIPQDAPQAHQNTPPNPVTIHTGSNQNINRIPVINSNSLLNKISHVSKNSSSNIIRVTNPNKPMKAPQNFTSIPSHTSQNAQNSNQAEKKNVSVNLTPDYMKTSINIASKNAVITSSNVNHSQVFNNNNDDDDDEFQNLPSVRRLAQSFGSSKQPNAPPRPNRANILLNRNISISNQTLSNPQKVNGVQSSLQNGDLGSQQHKVMPQSVNIKGNKNSVTQTRPVSVVNTRDITLEGHNSDLVQKAHSIQNLSTNSNDNVKTTLTVSFGNKSEKKTNNVDLNKAVVNKQLDNKNPENRHSWFGQKGDLMKEIESWKPTNNKPSSTLKTSNNSPDSTVAIKVGTTSKELSQHGQQETSENLKSQKLNITSVSSMVNDQSKANDKQQQPINVKKSLTNGKTAEDDDVLEVTPRMNLISWDPIKLLKRLYTVKLIEETAEDISYQYVSMEGFMEKLPMNKKKATLLKTWKRRFFKANDGWLHYYESSNRDKPSDSVQLMGGKIFEMTDLGSKILGIDDGRGRFLMVRVPSDKEYGQWKLALDTQTADNSKSCYVQPVLHSIPHPKKKVLVIDMGSSAIRAGILGQQASLPELFFPCIASVNKTTGDIIVGVDAYKPENRTNSTFICPVHPSNKIDRESIAIFTIDWKAITIIIKNIIQNLKINPSQYWVMLSTPQCLGDNLKEGLMDILVNDFHTCGVCMVQQSLLSLYSYKATSGIIVDIGQRIEILPIFDGFVIAGGVSRLPYGSEKILSSLSKSLLENNYSFSSPVEQLLVKYIMEQSCYVTCNYKNESDECQKPDNKVHTTVKLDNLDLPSTAYPEVKFDEGRYKSPEGLFDTDMWEMDYPNLHKLVFQAIQACPMDSRRHMYRAIYLSGGVTMLPGFADRFKMELMKLAPPGVPIEVHASQNRYHAAYIGACSVAGMNEFEMMCIDNRQWKEERKKAFRKWQAPTV